MGATSGGEWKRGTFPRLCQDVVPMHLPAPSQAPGNPKPWTHLHTSHLLWMLLPRSQGRHRAGLEVALELRHLCHVFPCALSLSAPHSTPQGEAGEKGEAPELLFAVPSIHGARAGQQG